MSIYGHKFDMFIESKKEELDSKQKEQQKLYYEAKNFSDAHNFSEAQKVINSMNNTKGENNYRIWAVAYMNRRKAEIAYKSASEEKKAEIDNVEKQLKKLFVIELTEKGLKGTVKITAGVLIIVFSPSDAKEGIEYLRTGADEVIESVSGAAKLISGAYETKDGYVFIPKV